MERVDEQRLESDNQYRYAFTAAFVGFDDDDVKAIQSFAPFLGPRIPEIVERTYEKLLNNTATARHFVPRNENYDGEVPATLEDLTPDHPQIRFRKDHLNHYFMQLIGRPYNEGMIRYLASVGIIHTSKAGSKEIDVPLVQMNALMGVISDLLMEYVLQAPLDPETTATTLRAFNRLLWIQNDFISRHYAQAAT